jgi:hypothetical protein
MSDRLEAQTAVANLLLEKDAFAVAIPSVDSALSRRVNADPENVERGLAQLVLTIIELPTSADGTPKRCAGSTTGRFPRIRLSAWGRRSWRSPIAWMNCAVSSDSTSKTST